MKKYMSEIEIVTLTAIEIEATAGAMQWCETICDGNRQNCRTVCYDV